MDQHQAFYKEYKTQFHKKYPLLDYANLISPAISPFVINLTQKTVDQICDLVQIFYKMAHLKKYSELIKTNQTQYLDTPVLDSSVLMSYDFHLDHNNSLKLIEVNTHSSGYLISDLVDQVHKTNQNKNFLCPLQSLKNSFCKEWEGFSGQTKAPEYTLIVDHQIQNQKMYMEFLMYKYLFRSWGWDCDLHDIKDLGIDAHGFLTDSHNKRVQMIYNRCTDFYFSQYPNLKKSFLNQTSCISSHPREYLLLADKNRLCEWSSLDFLNQLDLTLKQKQQIQEVVPFTALISSFSEEELWKTRKQFFFKPLNGYGGKSVYRGKNISHKIFNRVIKEEGIVQKIIPPPSFKDSFDTKWKYDIRAFVYKDQVQKITARVYQGQITQFQTPLSGIASVIIQ